MKKTKKKTTKTKKKTTKTNSTKQVGGTHYSIHKIEPWDYIAANGMGYLEGNVIKYVSRYPHKGGLEDLLKAHHYLEKLIEVVSDDSHSR